MSGDEIFVVLVIGVLVLAAWLAFELSRVARSAQRSNEQMLELLEKQSALIAADDALAYQAIRAAEVYGSYDNGSTQPDIEESPDGRGVDEPGSYGGFADDPFTEGNIFDQKL